MKSLNKISLIFTLLLVGCSGKELVTIEGYVYDFDKKPKANQKIYVSEMSRNWLMSGLLQVAEITTDEKGFFFLQVRVNNDVYIEPENIECDVNYGLLIFENNKYWSDKKINPVFYPQKSECK